MGLAIPSAYAQVMCEDCHKDMKFLIQNRKLFDYYKFWKDSVHDLAGVKCINCHGGDPTKTDKEAAHKGHFSPLYGGDKESLKLIVHRCGKCHKEILKNFISSKHYKVLIEKEKGPNCVTCHGSMNTGVYEAHNVAEGCKFCHNKETKNTPEVSQEAEKLLNYVNFIRSYRMWISTNYADEKSNMVKEINEQYKDIIFSWHQFNFEQNNEKTMNLLNKLKAIANKSRAEKAKKSKK